MYAFGLLLSSGLNDPSPRKGGRKLGTESCGPDGAGSPYEPLVECAEDLQPGNVVPRDTTDCAGVSSEQNTIVEEYDRQETQGADQTKASPIMSWHYHGVVKITSIDGWARSEPP